MSQPPSGHGPDPLDPDDPRRPERQPEQRPEGGGQPVAQPLSPSEEQGWSIGAHLGGILFGFLPALIIWLVFRERSRMVDDHAKEALNFQLTLLIVYIVGWTLTIILIGPLIWLAAWICAIVFGIMGAQAANTRRPFRYPVSVRILK